MFLFSFLTPHHFPPSSSSSSSSSLVVMVDSRFGILLEVMKKFCVAGVTCIFALGGALVGMITGAAIGQTTETGFFRGAGVGFVTGAIVAIELFESIISGDSPSKIDILGSLLNGKIFREWVSPAVLKAYQWQIATLESSHTEITDFYEVDGIKGLSRSYIKTLPKVSISSTETMDQCVETACSICLQDFRRGDCARRLPKCKHLFHLNCIDGWLVIQGTCPVCRDVLG